MTDITATIQSGTVINVEIPGVGTSGTSGLSGTSGSSGSSGTSGSSGSSGVSGSSGTSGNSGTSGTSGSSGTSGTSGTGLNPSDSPTFATVTCTNLTASRAVVTDASKKLASDVAATGSGSPVRASSPTLSDTPLAPTAADNVATTQIATTAFAQGQIANMANPLAIAQGIETIYAASGSTGIQIADNANINFGITGFTVAWEGSLPDWTPSAQANLLLKYQTGTHYWTLAVSTSGRIYFYLDKAAGVITIVSPGIDSTFIYGTTHMIVAVCERETESVAGSVTFYVDGVLFGSPAALAVGTPNDISNTGTLLINGTTVVNVVGIANAAKLFNRVLSASEVLSLYRNGISYADKWGSQTPIYTSDFSAGADGFVQNIGNANFQVTGNNDSILGEDNCLKCYANISVAFQIARPSSSILAGKRMKVTFDYYVETDSGLENSYLNVGVHGRRDTVGEGIQIVEGSWQTSKTIEFIQTGTTSEQFYFAAFTTSTGSITSALLIGKSVYFKNIVFKKVGAVLALQPEGIQPAPGQWLDSSSNKLHAMHPATGSSLIRRKPDFEIRWTNTWVGTNEAQYIGGINQAILPPNCYIESIIGVVAGATIEDIIIGDGSDTDRWVTITTGLAAGTVAFTPANRISDGTNYKMIVDPDANFTGSITWTIRGIILGM